MQPDSVVVSNAATVTGIESPVVINVYGGGYSLGCNSHFTKLAGFGRAGDRVCVRHRASSEGAELTATTLIVGGVASYFYSTTRIFARSIERGTSAIRGNVRAPPVYWRVAFGGPTLLGGRNPPTDADIDPRKRYPSAAIHAIRGEYSFSGKPAMFGGIDNLTGSLAPLGLLGNLAGEPYDAIGRYFYLGLDFDL